jgi:5,8-dihydroxy-2-naphthoate synthase
VVTASKERRLDERRSAKRRSITFAHSPDPDDAYMFYGFAAGAVKIPGYEVRHHLEDIQTLNERALRGEFEITAVSAHAYAHLSDRYWVLSCGASVGRGYGPILVSAKKNSIPHPTPLPSRERAKGEGWRIAIPGKWTTAALVLDLWLAEEGRHVELIVTPFDQILVAVENGVVDAGLIIHEGQLTYQRQGLYKLWDAGEWWHAKTGLPLPLGLDVVRSDLGLPLAKQISRALRESIVYANSHQDKAIEYALQYGRGLDTALGKRFVGMYVNEDTLRQGKEVQEGLKKLYELSYQRNLIPSCPVVEFI